MQRAGSTRALAPVSGAGLRCPRTSGTRPGAENAPGLLIHLQYFLWFVAALAGILAAGSLAYRLVFPAPPRSGSLCVLAVACLGCYAWVCYLFALCCTGLYRGGPIIVGWVAVVLAAMAVLVLGPARVPRLRPPGAAAIAGGVLLTVVLATRFIGAIAPGLMWDADTYHLTLPRLYLEAGGFVDVPFSIYAKLPLGVELLFGYAMVLDDYILAKTLQIGAGLGIVIAVNACLREEPRLTRWLATILVLADTWVAHELGVAYVDLFTALFFFASFVFAREAAAAEDAPAARPWLLMSGVGAGLLTGSKANGWLGALCIAAYLVAPAVYRMRLSGARAAAVAEIRRITVAFGVPVVVMWLAWAARALVQTGNPVFPLLYSWLGGPDDWSPRVNAQFMDWILGVGMGRGVLDYLLLPYRIVASGELFQGRIGTWWLAAVPLSALVAVRVAAVRAPLAVAGMFFVTWAAGSQQLRLLLPALPLLCVAVAVSSGHLARRLLPGRFAVVAMLALCTAGAREVYYVMVLHVVQAYRAWEGVPAWAGSDPRRAMTPAAYAFVNEHAPPTATVLLLHTNQGFCLDRRYLADSSFQASQIVDWLGAAPDAAATRALLAERGVDWVVELMNPVPGTRIEYPPGLAALLGDPRHATTVFTGPQHRVYHLQ